MTGGVRIEPGAVLAERYHLREKIGSGGVGDVWRAHDSVLDRDVALKVLRIDDDTELREATLREARVASRLRSDSIVVVHDVVDVGELVIIVMEFLDGPTVREEIKRRGRVSARMARAVMTEVAAALAEAHDRGVVHRDIKPGNIFWLDDGRIVVCDFGLAKVSDSETTSDGRAAAGTPEYMPPEQFNGDPLGPPADIWAWGATAYELVTGRAPYGKRSEGLQPIAIATRIMAGEPHSPLTLDDDPELASIIDDCLVRDPFGRVPDGRALFDRLQRTDQNRRGAAPPTPEPTVATAPVDVPEPPPTDAVEPVVVSNTAFVPPPPPPAHGPVPPPPVSHEPTAGHPPVLPVEEPAERPAWAVPVLAVFAVLLLAAGAAFGWAIGQRSSAIDRETSIEPLPLPAVVDSTPDARTPIQFVRVSSPSCTDLLSEPAGDTALRCAAPGSVLPSTGSSTAEAGVDYLRVYDVVSGNVAFVNRNDVVNI